LANGSRECGPDDQLRVISAANQDVSRYLDFSSAFIVAREAMAGLNLSIAGDDAAMFRITWPKRQ
jgi:hypothetical protein